MKKLVTLLTALVLTFVLATGVSAQAAGITVSKEITISLNGQMIDFGDQEPIIEKSTTLVPAREIFEALDYAVDWDQEHGVISAEKYGLTVALQIGNAIGYINGIEVPLTTAPVLVSDTAFVPVRFLSEAIGFDVEWKSDTRTVVLTKVDSKGYIWKVEKDGVEVHLLGSFHVGDTKMYPLRTEIEEAFDAADYLVVEVDITKAPDEQTQKAIQAVQLYADGSTLKDHVSADTYARIQTFLEALGLPVNAYDKYKPWAVNLDMTNFLAASSGYQGGLGIDMYYLQRASLANKPILELESYMLQMDMFDSYSKELQEQQVNELLDSIFGLVETSTEESGVDVMAKIWIEGDDETLEGLIDATQEEKEVYEKLLKNRHEGMLKQIEAYLNKGEKESYFVVVGFLHMLGEDGLITQLKEKGYTVTRI